MLFARGHKLVKLTPECGLNDLINVTCKAVDLETSRCCAAGTAWMAYPTWEASSC